MEMIFIWWLFFVDYGLFMGFLWVVSVGFGSGFFWLLLFLLNNKTQFCFFPNSLISCHTFFEAEYDPNWCAKAVLAQAARRPHVVPNLILLEIMRSHFTPHYPELQDLH